MDFVPVVAARLARLGQRSALMAAALFLLATAIPASAQNDSHVITLQTGQSTVLSTPGLSRVAVGNSAIAGVVPVGTSEVVVNAKDNGRTTVVIWEGGYQVSYTVVVTDFGLDDIAAMIKASVSDPNVHFVNFQHALIVRGQVDSRSEYLAIQALLNRFEPMAKANKFTVVNALTQKHSYAAIAREISTPGAQDISVEPDAQGNLIVSGQVQTRVQAEQVLQRATSLAGADYSAAGKLIDRLNVKGVSQIDIKVYVLEIDETGMGELGLRLQSARADNTKPGGFDYFLPNFPVVENCGACSSGKALNAGPWIRTTLLAPTLDVIMQTGHARILSSPDLVATNGTAASFLVGGQFPYLFSTGLGQVSVDFKNYGVQLKVTPTLMANGDVSALITPDISDLDFENAVQFNGFLIPALKESTISTSVIAQDGQSIVLGGLLRHLDSRTIQKIPILSNIPVLGKLFQSVAYQHGDTNVVFVMTPRVITTP
ncbi:MAG: pilus assembly protein N-terminal domain-containing protein [Candidatus Eremiobacteraeota bacterium]|nr:pilus assembly protein N-terminal domain-containing protein [Candidatus Eremiobacteraeota bacterium]